MAQTLHVKAIGDELARLVAADHKGKSPLNLKEVFFGSLEHYPAPTKDWIHDHVPVVLVLPNSTDFTKQTLGPSGKWGSVTYFRILHYWILSDNEAVWTTKANNAQSISDTLFAAYALPALSLSNADVTETRVSRVELRPPEEAIAQDAYARMAVNAVNVEVELNGIRKS